MVHLITGYAGKEHITSADQGSFNAAVMGNGEFVLEGGEQFRCQVISNNKVRIFDGEALMQGRHIKVERNTYEETTHDNGTQGYKRIDLVVLTYTKNATTGIEGVTLDVIKGTPAASNPAVPDYVTGDIINLGELKNQMPLYKIPFDGLSIGEPVALFSTVPTLEGMKKEVDAEVETKKEELDEKFAELEDSIEEKIAEAGKPLSSNADDWALIENYGEYSADAKTVGEELKKLNDSLNKFIIALYPYGFPLVPTLSANDDNVISSHLSAAFRVFDNNGATEWAVQGTNAWIGYKFETAKVVKKVEYHPYIYGSEGYNSTIYIQGSDDGINWTNVHSFANPKTSTATSVTFNNETAYKYWRFNTVALAYNSSVYYTRLYSLQFYGF